MSALIIAVVGILMAVTLATALVVDADIRRMERTAASSRAWATALQPYVLESSTVTAHRHPHRHKVKARVMSRPNDPYPGWQP